MSSTQPTIKRTGILLGIEAKKDSAYLQDKNTITGSSKQQHQKKEDRSSSSDEEKDEKYGRSSQNSRMAMETATSAWYDDGSVINNGQPVKPVEAPKMYLSPYLIFAQEKRKELIGMTATEQMKEVGRQWNKLNYLEKAQYEIKSQKDKDRYTEELDMLPPGVVPYQKMKIRRRKKDKTLPKKALTPYILFVKEQRPKLAEENPTMGFADMMKKLGEKWKKMSEGQKLPYARLAYDDKIRHKEETERVERDKQNTTTVHRDKTGMPKKPLSAYLLFARDVRDKLKRKQPNASVSDIMKAVSIDWAKLSTEKKSSYFDTAKRNTDAYKKQYKEWCKQNGGGKVNNIQKQINIIDSKRKPSIVSFISHGQDFIEAANAKIIPVELSIQTQTSMLSEIPNKEQQISNEISEAGKEKIRRFLMRDDMTEMSFENQLLSHCDNEVPQDFQNSAPAANADEEGDQKEDEQKPNEEQQDGDKANEQEEKEQAADQVQKDIDEDDSQLQLQRDSFND